MSGAEQWIVISLSCFLGVLLGMALSVTETGKRFLR